MKSGVAKLHTELLKPKRFSKRFYRPDGYRVQTVAFPLSRVFFGWSVAFAALLIPLIIMLGIREDRQTAEWWTTHIQAGWESAIGRMTGFLPCSVLELLIVLGIIFGVYLFVRLFVNACKGRPKRIAFGCIALFTFGAYLLDLYIMSMGFGYYRAIMPIPQSDKKYTAEEARLVIEYFLDDYNSLANGFERDENGCVICPYSFSELATLMKSEYTRLDAEFYGGYFAEYTPTAKPLVNSWFLSDMLITGITFLPFGEATLNVDAPPTSVAATLAHELAHTKGVQREGDANLIARYLLVSSTDDYLRYCGYYAAFDNMLSALVLAGDYDGYFELGAKISTLVSKERAYAANYWNSQPDFIGQLAEFFNNLYLKLNGATNGTGSYNDGNKGDVVIPIDPDTGEPEKDPDTGEIVREINYSQVQKMFFRIYEEKSGIVNS